VTHVLPTVLNLADCILLMGVRSALFGSLEAVLQEKSLSELYGVPVHLGTVAGKRTLVVGRPGASDV
jgi:hypothetical protein